MPRYRKPIPLTIVSMGATLDTVTGTNMFLAVSNTNKRPIPRCKFAHQDDSAIAVPILEIESLSGEMFHYYLTKPETRIYLLKLIEKIYPSSSFFASGINACEFGKNLYEEGVTPERLISEKMEMDFDHRKCLYALASYLSEGCRASSIPTLINIVSGVESIHSEYVSRLGCCKASATDWIEAIVVKSFRMSY